MNLNREELMAEAMMIISSADEEEKEGRLELVKLIITSHVKG